MNCKGCESENIILKERLGAYDGFLAIQCQDCGKTFHRCGLEVIKEEQKEQYGAVHFELEGGVKAINLKLIN